MVERETLPTIERKDRQRVNTVTCVVNADEASLSDVVEGGLAQIEEMRAEGLLSGDASIIVAGSYEDQQDSFKDMATLGLLILIIVYIVMAAQFESWSDPTIIMLVSIPFTFTGIVLALWLTGVDLNIMSMLGAIMLIGIGIALMFVTRSLLQPVYILGTLLIAYLCSLSINQWIVKAVLGRSMLTWNTPFFSFIMLIALGVDYSIFLMTRYNELKEEGFTTPSSRILKACAIIGTVVISAAIILGGTFAALIPSGIPTLIEVALTVDVGLLILVFILPITLSAAVKLTYEGIDFSKYFKRNRTNNN